MTFNYIIGKTIQNCLLVITVFPHIIADDNNKLHNNKEVSQNIITKSLRDIMHK
jgi:hypothetical protein